MSPSCPRRASPHGLGEPKKRAGLFRNRSAEQERRGAGDAVGEEKRCHREDMDEKKPAVQACVGAPALVMLFGLMVFKPF